ncbi:MAG: ABC transporter permease, partial [Gemmataceae bacterium]
MSVTPAMPAATSPLQEAWIVYRRNKAAMLGTVLLIAMVALVIYGSFFYKADPYEIVWAPQTPPGTAASVPLGTDYLGRD